VALQTDEYASHSIPRFEATHADRVARLPIQRSAHMKSSRLFPLDLAHGQGNVADGDTDAASFDAKRWMICGANP
jgi:hypothetical protein